MEQTNLNIGTIGQKLETARQAKGVSVSEAGAATKILSKFIEAMEADDFGSLSAPVYAKSFLKMYATYLGLDAEPLVAEYATQNADRPPRQLSDEVRQNLAKVDQVSVEEPVPAVAVAGEGKQVFGGVNQSITKLPGSHLSPKTWAIAGGSLLALLIILLSATQCESDDEDAPAPAASGAAITAEREMIDEGVPDVYLVKPNVVDVEK
ncbi:MAG: helix-turn-helix transcriptional regulator [Verrucomicrobiota bacterium]